MIFCVINGTTAKCFSEAYINFEPSLTLSYFILNLITEYSFASSKQV